jgi:hypothetical protein
MKLFYDAQVDIGSDIEECFSPKLDHFFVAD